MQHPGVASDDGAARDIAATYLHTRRWDDALEGETSGRVQAERLLDYGVEVRQFLGLGPRDGAVFAVDNGAVADTFVQLHHQLLVASWVLQEEVEDGAQADGGGFGSGEHHADAGGQDLDVGHKVRVVMLCLNEFREQVDPRGVV